VLVLSEGSTQAECAFPGDNEHQHFGSLAPGATRTRTYEVFCGQLGGDAAIELSATVDAGARDPNSSNNSHSTGPIDLE
jgi:hypothetical protein